MQLIKCHIYGYKVIQVKKYLYNSWQCNWGLNPSGRKLAIGSTLPLQLQPLAHKMYFCLIKPCNLSRILDPLKRNTSHTRTCFTTFLVSTWLVGPPLIIPASHDSNSVHMCFVAALFPFTPHLCACINKCVYLTLHPPSLSLSSVLPTPPPYHPPPTPSHVPLLTSLSFPVSAYLNCPFPTPPLFPPNTSLFFVSLLSPFRHPFIIRTCICLYIFVCTFMSTVVHIHACI